MNQKFIEFVSKTSEDIDWVIDDERFFTEDWKEGNLGLDRYCGHDQDSSSLLEIGKEFFYHHSYDQYIREWYWEQVYSKFSRLGQREQEGMKVKEKKKENKKAFLARRRDRQKEERKKDRRPSRRKRVEDLMESVDILETISPSWAF